MFQIISRLNLIKNIKYFKKAENFNNIEVFKELFRFSMELLLISMTFTFLENGVETLISKTPEEILNLFGNSIYFVLTTATTVGYGDISPTNLFSKIFVSLFIFIYLSARLIKILSVFIEAKNKNIKLKEIGRLFQTMNNHIIISTDANTIKQDNFLWLKRFVKENEISTKFKNSSILLVNSNQDASLMLNDAMINNQNFHGRVQHLNINIDEDDFFEKISIKDAAQVYILGNPEDNHSDSQVFDLSYQIKKYSDYKGNITAEVINDKNRERMYEVGVNVIMRPNRSYPEMLITSTISPGISHVLEELSSRGNDTLEVFNIPSDVKEFQWSDILINLSVEGIGTSIGVIYENNVDVNPMGKDIIKDGSKLIMMIHEMKEKSYEDIQSKINDSFESIKK